MGVCEAKKVVNDILSGTFNGEDDWGYSMTFYKMIHKPLTPGPELDAMNRVIAQRFATSIDGNIGQWSVQLLDFIKREIARLSPRTPKPSFKDSAVADGFW